MDPFVIKLVAYVFVAIIGLLITYLGSIIKEGYILGIGIIMILVDLVVAIATL